MIHCSKQMEIIFFHHHIKYIYFLLLLSVIDFFFACLFVVVFCWGVDGALNHGKFITQSSSLLDIQAICKKYPWLYVL